MLFNYIKIALRNLSKNTLFSFINVSGMALSLASCFLIGLFAWDELKFDRHHPEGDRTFRIYNIRQGNDGVTNFLPVVPIPFASYLAKDFPEIESTLRIMDTYGEQMFDPHGHKIMEGAGIYAEQTVFDMLSLHVTQGISRNALEKPNTIALSQSLAHKYFSEANPLGENLVIGDETYQVTAVFEDVPTHFHLKISYILSFATVSKNWNSSHYENWQWQQFFTYIKLRPGTDARALEAKFLAFVEKYAYPKIKSVGFTYVPHLQNIKDIHLHSSNFEWEMAQRGNVQTVYILSVTAGILLIISSLNFINLSTARAIRRMKEVGIRKVVGAFRTQLIVQFIAESVVITFIGLIFALVIAQLALPYLNTFAEKQLFLPITFSHGAWIILFCVLLGICAGSYPAFYLSRFRPAAVLYNKQQTGSGAGLFRQGLIVIQFIFSFCLIVGAMIVFSQEDLLRNKNLGFDKEHLIMIPLRHGQLVNYEVTKREFASHPGVVSATVGFGIPGDIIAGDEIRDPVKNKTTPTSLFCVDFDFIQTMGMEVIAGRNFSHDYTSDPNHAFILNETAVHILGFESPEAAIGKPLNWNMWGRDSIKQGEVIGVVKDFHIKSLRDKLSPVVMHIYPSAYWKLTLRIRPDQMQETIAHLRRTYERLDPEWTFTYSFVDQKFDSMYRAEEKLSKLLSIFTTMTIIVACLGLFGLVEYSVNQRAKEISIRKVFGASVQSLLVMLTRTYFLLVMIAFVVIIPISYFFATQWLNTFAYHISISPWIYIKALSMIALITLVTVSFQSLKAAWSNPAKVLKNE